MCPNQKIQIQSDSFIVCLRLFPSLSLSEDADFICQLYSLPSSVQLLSGLKDAFLILNFYRLSSSFQLFVWCKRCRFYLLALQCVFFQFDDQYIQILSASFILHLHQFLFFLEWQIQILYGSFKVCFHHFLQLSSLEDSDFLCQL